MTIRLNAPTPVGPDPQAKVAERPAPAEVRRVEAAAPAEEPAHELHLLGADDEARNAPDDAAAARADAPSPAPEFRLQQLAIRKHPDMNRVIVQVIDAETGEVVRQIPPEEWVQVLERLQSAKGVLVDREG